MNYKSLDFNPNNSLVDEPEPKPVFKSLTLHSLPDVLPNIAEQVDNIIDNEIIVINDGRTCRYLIH